MIRFLRNIRRALKYNRAKHIPVAEFIGGVEDRWRRPIDSSSRYWLLHNPMLVDLLNQMLSGQLRSGDDALNHRICFLFLVQMFLRSDVDPATLKGEEAFADIVDKFHESHPDAATLVLYAFKAFWANVEKPA
ncbi:MAG: hypothetical protein KBE65_07705 [Phycisphaerae bacterium]|nr:hypothetical protein [Phycisphaerae bacterium]